MLVDNVVSSQPEIMRMTLDEVVQGPMAWIVVSPLVRCQRLLVQTHSKLNYIAPRKADACSELLTALHREWLEACELRQRCL